MKVKYSVIPFILAVIKLSDLMSVFGLDGSGMFLGMNKMELHMQLSVLLLHFFLCV